MNILCAVDPNDDWSSRILSTANRLRRPGDSLIVVHVLPRPLEWYRDPGSSLESRTFQERERLRALIQKELDRLEGIEAEVSVPLGESGNAGQDLIALAEKRGVDLMVVGTHGRTGLSALALGSVAERVVRHAGCDVYVVKT